MTITPFINDAIGWTGAALVLLAYALLSIRWMSGNSFSYQALNVTGAAMLVINSWHLGAYPSVGVNAAWVGIAILTLLREWWKGPAEAVRKAGSQFSKRANLQHITLERIKLPNFKNQAGKVRKTRPTANNLGQTQLT